MFMEHTTRHSTKRDAILDCIRMTDTHPSAEWVYQQLKPRIPGLSLATVYRNLTLFKSQGLIQSVGTVDGLERFDGNPAPHVHFVCRRCGQIRDLHEICVPSELAARAEALLGSRVLSTSLTFEGLCTGCTADQNQ